MRQRCIRDGVRIGALAGRAIATAILGSVLWAPGVFASGPPSAGSTPIPTDDASAVMPGGIKLPPDPGPAGDATVAGISTAVNGVRDDVVIEIVSAFPNNPKAVAALLEMARYWQDMLLHNTDANVVANSWSYISGLSKCFQTAVGNPQAEADDTLLPLMLTTHDRWMAYINANETVHVAPKTVTCP